MSRRIDDDLRARQRIPFSDHRIPRSPAPRTQCSAAPTIAWPATHSKATSPATDRIGPRLASALQQPLVMRALVSLQHTRRHRPQAAQRQRQLQRKVIDAWRRRFAILERDRRECFRAVFPCRHICLVLFVYHLTCHHTAIHDPKFQVSRSGLTPASHSVLRKK